jgi:hypothetical protein
MEENSSVNVGLEMEHEQGGMRANKENKVIT